MAYDYDTDILAGLWTGAEDAAEPYAAFLTANPTLTNDVAENRILSTIEALRSHMTLMNSRDEARLLHFCLSAMLEGAGSGGFVYTGSSADAVVEGNVVNPVFVIGDDFEIWSIDGVSGVAALATLAATGTTLADLIADINGTAAVTAAGITASRTPDGRLRIAQRSVAEVSTIQTTAEDAGVGTLDGDFFDYDTPNNLYRIWFNTVGGGGAGAPLAGGRTLVQVDVGLADIADDVATALAAAMDALVDVTASAVADLVTATNTDIGSVTDAVDGTTPTGFTILTTVQGLRATGFGIVVDSTDVSQVVPQKAGIRLDENPIEAGLTDADHRGAYFLTKSAEVANEARDRALEVFAGQIRSASQSNIV